MVFRLLWWHVPVTLPMISDSKRRG
jgi:hypothetical protein